MIKVYVISYLALLTTGILGFCIKWALYSENIVLYGIGNFTVECIPYILLYLFYVKNIKDKRDDFLIKNDTDIFTSFLLCSVLFGCLGFGLALAFEASFLPDSFSGIHGGLRLGIEELEEGSFNFDIRLKVFFEEFKSYAQSGFVLGITCWGVFIQKNPLIKIGSIAMHAIYLFALSEGYMRF